MLSPFPWKILVYNICYDIWFYCYPEKNLLHPLHHSLSYFVNTVLNHLSRSSMLLYQNRHLKFLFATLSGLVPFVLLTFFCTVILPPAINFGLTVFTIIGFVSSTSFRRRSSWDIDIGDIPGYLDFPW